MGVNYLKKECLKEMQTIQLRSCGHSAPLDRVDAIRGSYIRLKARTIEPLRKVGGFVTEIVATLRDHLKRCHQVL